MNKRIKYFLFILIVASGLLIYYALGQDGATRSDGKTLVAIVGGAELTDHDLLFLLTNPEVDNYRLKILSEDWINRELLAQEAEKKENLDLDRLSESIKNYRRELLANLYLEGRYREIPYISDEEIQNYYNNNIESFIRNERQIRSYHFLLDSKESAFDLKNALSSSDEKMMSQLLSRYHGTLRTFGRDDVIEEISSAAFGSRRDIVGPIETEYGFHILQILDRFDEESIIPPHEVREDIIQRIKIQKQNILYFNIIDSLRFSNQFYINESYFE